MKTLPQLLFGAGLVWIACGPLPAAEQRPDLVGRVAHEDESPVTNATVFIYTAGPKTGTGIVCPSCYPDCSKRANTDARGAFKIPSLDPALVFRLLVVAPGHESQYAPKTNPTLGEKTITLTPLSAEKLKFKNRIAGLATDQNGYFLVPNVPAAREFVLYSKMESLRGQGGVSSKTFTTGKSGAVLKLGTLPVQPAHRLAGRVVLSDAQPVPPKTRLLLSREQAWDHAETTLDAEGRFEFTDVPAESVGLSVRIKGYKFSKRNPSLDWLNGGLVGRVTGDLPDLTLLMEPGTWRYNGEEGESPSGQSQPRDQPLRGAKP